MEARGAIVALLLVWMVSRAFVVARFQSETSDVGMPTLVAGVIKCLLVGVAITFILEKTLHLWIWWAGVLVVVCLLMFEMVMHYRSAHHRLPPLKARPSPEPCCAENVSFSCAEACAQMS